MINVPTTVADASFRTTSAKTPETSRANNNVTQPANAIDQITRPLRVEERGREVLVAQVGQTCTLPGNRKSHVGQTPAPQSRHRTTASTSGWRWHRAPPSEGKASQAAGSASIVRRLARWLPQPGHKWLPSGWWKSQAEQISFRQRAQAHVAATPG